jgi:hypothetical protein
LILGPLRIFEKSKAKTGLSNFSQSFLLQVYNLFDWEGISMKKKLFMVFALLLTSSIIIWGSFTPTGILTALSQSGGDSDNAEPAQPEAPEDQVIADDLIVTGSICTGFDCILNESFGFDTLRLKENNLRIAFDDTSATAGFPANDWQIVANDSASGGQNYLTFWDVTGGTYPFKVMAGTPNNALFASSAGIGLGTNQPQDDMNLATSNAANELGIQFDNTANNDHWRLFLSPAGEIKISEVSTATAELTLDAGGNLFITGALAQGSDAASKRDFAQVDRSNLLQKLAELPITTWSYKADDPGVRHLGPMSQDFYTLFGLGANATTISPLDASSVALAGVQELTTTLESQQDRINELEQTNSQLNDRITEMETRLAALEGSRGPAALAGWTYVIPWILFGAALVSRFGWSKRR